MNGRNIWLLVAMALIAAPAGTLSATERPNFLFIYTDDQRWDALGSVQKEQGEAARFPWFQTPNLDRLAGEGVRFRNAFVVSSLCAPSRAAFLTGRYNHHNGVVNNHTPFPTDAVTWPSLLRAAGYKTGYVGKWHMGGQTGKRPGFDYSASFVGQGRYVDCPFEIDGKATPTKGWVDDVSTDFAIEFLKGHREESFALIVGYKSAHGPFDPPERLAEKYAGAAAKKVPNYDLPAVYKGKFDGGRPVPAQGKKGKKAGGAKKTKAPAGPIDGPSKMRGYFGCLAAVDENVGRLLDTLDELKLADNTVVVFASDNGFYLGEHNLGDKRSAYEESLRIPLLVRYPRLGAAAKGKLIDELALNIDLAPTFLDLAGVKIPAQVQGASWRLLLEGKATNWRKSFFYEYFYERNFAIPTTLAVRTTDAKLIKYPGHDDWTELFDLNADPYETQNLAGDPAAKDLLAKMTAEFDKQSRAVGFVVPEFADAVPEQSR
jgi:N-acetylglucosamine-6-sulfatase